MVEGHLHGNSLRKTLSIHSSTEIISSRYSKFLFSLQLRSSFQFSVPKSIYATRSGYGLSLLLIRFCLKSVLANASARVIAAFRDWNLCNSCAFIYEYPVFNAVQSKCFNTIYGTNDNVVLASPTGSGRSRLVSTARLFESLASCVGGEAQSAAAQSSFDFALCATCS